MENWRKFLEEQRSYKPGEYRGYRDALGRPDPNRRGTRPGEESGFTDYQMRRARELGMDPRNIPPEPSPKQARRSADGGGYNDSAFSTQRAKKPSDPGTVSASNLPDLSSVFDPVEQGGLLSATVDFLRNGSADFIDDEMKNIYINSIEREINTRIESGKSEEYEFGDNQGDYKKSQILKLLLSLNSALAASEDKDNDGVSDEKELSIIDKGEI